MYNHIQIHFELPNLQDQKLLMLYRGRLCHWVIHNMQLADWAYSIMDIILAAIQSFLLIFSLITTFFFNNTSKYIL